MAQRAFSSTVEGSDFTGTDPYVGSGLQTSGTVLSNTAGPALISSGAGTVWSGVNDAVGVRFVSPVSGTLSNVSVFMGGTNSGNFDLAVYDCSATTRNRLATKGTTAFGAGLINTWQGFNPNIYVRAGAHFDIVFALDNTTATTAKLSASDATRMAACNLPTGYLATPQGGAPWLIWKFPAAGVPLPTTLAEASLAASALVVPMIALVS